ncbi:hypothetical protein AMTRI_Chr12g268770 [Amborella trichopoda]
MKRWGRNLVKGEQLYRTSDCFLVLILDAVHWNPDAPPRTLPRVRLRCGKAPPCCGMKKILNGSYR